MQRESVIEGPVGVSNMHGKGEDASRHPKSENGMYPSPLRQTCMPKPSMDRTCNVEGRKVPQRNEAKGKRGETAAKGDYKEKYSPHSLPTHALQGDYAAKNSASLASLHARRKQCRVAGFPIDFNLQTHPAE